MSGSDPVGIEPFAPPSPPATLWAPPPPPGQQWAPQPPPPGQQWSPYVAPGVGRRAPRSRRWIIVGAVSAVAVLVVAGGFVWWNHRQVPSATGSVQSDGSTVVDSRGIHIMTPAGWTVVSTTPAALAKAAKTLEGSNPQVAAAVQGLESRQQGDALRFFAYGTPSLDGFTSDADVLVQDSTLPLSEVVSASQAGLASAGATDIQVTGVVSGASNADELTYRLPLTLPSGGTVSINVEQVYVSNGSEVGILTMGTTQGTDNDFQAILSSFRLT
jgi:hypothetical protein